MRLRPLLLAILLVTSPALAVDIEFSAPRRTGPAAYSQYGAGLASNGIDYLAAWTTSGPETHVYAAQVLADGTLPQEIATQLDAGTQARAAWGVSISAGRDGYFASWLTDRGVTFAVLDSFGRVERTSSFSTSSYGGTTTAWDGSTHLVLYGTDSGDSMGVIVDDNANIFASNISVAKQSDGTSAGTLIADGSGFLVLARRPGFAGNPDVIFGRRITPNGSVGEWFQIRTTASPLTSIAALYDGTRDIIVWADTFGIWRAELDPKTNVLGTSRQISSAAGTTWVRMTRLNGQIWIASWEQTTSTAFATPLNADGTAGTKVVIGKGYVPDINTNGQSIFSIRSAERDPSTTGNMDVVGRFVSTASNDFVVSKSQTDQSNGDLASDGATVLAAWDEEIGTRREIFAARHPLGVAAPDGAGVQISSGGFNRFATAASNGKSWLIAWIRADSANTGTAVVVARRFSADGHLLDSEDIVLGPAVAYSNKLRVASDGSSWVVAWLATRPGGGCGHGQSTRPILARVSSDGALLDPDGVDITESIALDTTDIDLAWDGSRYVAAWASYCWYGGHTTPTHNVSGAFISPDLADVDILPLSGALTATSVLTPRVTANVNGALIAWERGGKTEYVVVTGSSVPKPARSRAVSVPRVIQSVEGSLVGVCPAATGEWMMLTKKKIPWAVNNGVFFSIPDAHGTIIGTGLGAILDGDEFFTGHVARLGKYAWVADSRFDAPAGALRQWMTVVDSPR